MKNNFSFDLSKFKKVHGDKNSTTLEHPSGHSIKIAHSALSPKMRGQLASMPSIEHYDDGGQVQKPQDNNDQDAAKSIGSAFGAPTRDLTKEDNSYKGMAEGGDVADPQDTRDIYRKKKLEESPPPDSATHVDPDKAKQFKMAEGGQVDEQKDSKPEDKKKADKKAQDAETTKNVIKAFALPFTGGMPMKDGGDVKPAEKLDIVPVTEAEAAPEALAQSVDLPPAPPAAPAAQPQGLAGPGEPTAPQNPQANPQVPDPTLEGGYQEQMQGLKAQANAEGQLGASRANALQHSLNQQQQTLNQFNKNFNDLMTERKNTIQDVKNGHIDPEKYWQNHSKIASTIGVILGSLNFSQPGKNAALDMLHQQMEANLQAQAKNLDSNHNLLRSNMEQFHNIKDAADFTRIQQNDMLSHQLDMEAAKQTNPMVQAKYQQLAGQLQAQNAPLFQQFAMRRALMGNQSGLPDGSQQPGQMQGGQQQPGQMRPAMQQSGQQSNLIKHDPASFVQYIVPKEQQELVSKTIGDVQAAKANEDEILQQFDVAAKSPGKAVGVGPGAAAQKRMGALFLPMIHDQEGRVNEYEQKTLMDLTPTTLDTPATLEKKRQGLQDFIHNKINKGNAIVMSASGGAMDLNKFESTAPKGYAPEIKTLGGVKYQKVNGGWQKVK